MNYSQLKSWLWPPEEFLQKIGFDANPFWGIDIIPYTSNKFATTLYASSQIQKVKSLWVDYYQFTFVDNFHKLQAFKAKVESENFTQRAFWVLSELIKNTFEHGNIHKNEALAWVGYWITTEGIVFGVKDEGDFYSKKETLEKFDLRERFLSTKELASGHGIKGCYRRGDFMKVCTEQNAFFIGFLLDTPGV
jgi:hypothetical protein